MQSNDGEQTQKSKTCKYRQQERATLSGREFRDALMKGARTRQIELSARKKKHSEHCTAGMEEANAIIHHDDIHEFQLLA